MENSPRLSESGFNLVIPVALCPSLLAQAKVKKVPFFCPENLIKALQNDVSQICLLVNCISETVYVSVSQG